MLLLSLLPNINGIIRKQRHRFLQLAELGAGKRYGKGLGWSFQNVDDEKHMAHPLFMEKATPN